MLRAVLLRVLSFAGVLLFLTLVVFFVQRSLPADPARALAGRTATPEALAAARDRLGLDRPFLPEYVRFLGRLVRGDLGESVSTRHPVAQDIGTYLPATLELVIVASVMAVVGGLVLGIIGARSGVLADGVRLLGIAGASTATFLLGVLALLVFYRNLGWLPGGGRSDDGLRSDPTGFLLVDTLLRGDPAAWVGAWAHLLLPASVLALAPATSIGRVLRGSLRTTLRSDQVRSATAKGATWWSVVRRHGLRNSGGPALSVAGLQIGLMLGGSVVVELIFSWPGVGSYLAAAIRGSDFAAVAGVVLVLGLAYLLINLVVDTLQLVLDPRQRSRS